MNEKVQQEIEKNGRYIAFYINQKGEFFQKGYPSPFLRDKAIKKLKYAGVRNTGKANYQKKQEGKMFEKETTAKLILYVEGEKSYEEIYNLINEKLKDKISGLQILDVWQEEI